jgi:hypothetical protein
MKKPRRIFYTKELPAKDEIDLSKAKHLSDKEFLRLLKKSAEPKSPKK